MDKLITMTEKELSDLVYLAIKDGRFEPYVTREENSSIPMLQAFRNAANRIVEEFKNKKKNG